ncbi:MAG: hypothetical protein K6D96_10500 [Acetatifactor sp.]|nr:hypothetical protein [Acetatifactor sp.]
MKKFIKDNKGFSLVVVIIAVAFATMLTTLILYLALFNFRIRLAQSANKENFYSAERALEEVRAGLENVVSDCIGNAYLNVLEKYENYDGDERSDEFVYVYVTELRKALSIAGSDYYFDIGKLENFLVDTRWDSTEGYGARISSMVGNSDRRDYGNMVSASDGLVLKNVRVTYVSPTGVISIIETDIKLNVPSYNFTDSMKIPDIISFGIVANNGVDITSATTIKGNIYAGDEGINIGYGATRITGTDLIITDGDFNISGQSLTIDAAPDIWARNIVVDNSAISSSANMYVRDDLIFLGNGSNVSLNGEYYGYGYNEDLAAESSAIIVNGLNARIDMSGVTKLYLGGRSFIKTEGTVTGGGNTFTNANVAMGESFAAKSDQIAYLVPPECLWVKDGKSMFGSNPVAYDQIDTAAETAGATEVDLSVMSNLLGVSMDHYANGYRKVYSNKSGVMLVYYYLTFSTPERANYFFNAYYNADKTRMDKYLSHYIADAKLPVDTMLRVNLAGNVFRKVNGSFVLENSTSTTDSKSELKAESDKYLETYNRLCTQLSTAEIGTDAANEKAARGIFYNVIDRDAINTIVPNVGDKKIAYEPAGQGVVIVNNGANPYKLSAHEGDVSTWADIKVIIATGDVEVDRSYEGIIIAGGNVKVSGGVNVTADTVKASQALKATVGYVDGNNYPAINLFSEGEFLYGSSGSESNGVISTTDLVTYENWSKE